MPSPIEAVTTAALSAALDAASRRQVLVAGNIANAGAPGYVPLRLSFDAQLADARESLRAGRLLDDRALEALQGLGAVAPEAQEGAEGVQLDAEMVALAGNAAHFQALVQGVARHLSLLALAASDGKR